MKTGYHPRGVLTALLTATALAYMGFGLLANNALSDVHACAAHHRPAN